MTVQYLESKLEFRLITNLGEFVKEFGKSKSILNCLKPPSSTFYITL